MSQKTKRGSASLDEKDKIRTDSPVKDMKKKAAANAEKERAAAEKAATEQNNGKPAPSPSPTSGKPASAANQTSGKTAPAVNQNSGSKAAPAQVSSKSAPAAAQNSGKTTPTAVQNSGKTTPAAVQISGKTTTANPAAVQNLKDIPLPADKPKDDLKADKVEKPKQTVAPEPAKPLPDTAKQNGSGKDGRANSNTANVVGVSDVALNRNGRSATPDAFNGITVSRSPVLEDELRIAEEDELFPELTYDDTSDNDASAGDGGRSMTRRSQVKAARTPETPRPVPHKPASGDDKAAEETANADPSKGDTKLLKLRDEYSASPMKLRSSDRSTPEPAKAADGVRAQAGEDNKPDDVNDNDEIKNNKEDDNAESESKNDGETSTKRDTNFSKSRIKISPYRRSTRLQDSMLANYTGNNTTMEMDISELSELASTSADPALADTSYVRGLKNIRGRRSYKPLGEFLVRSITSRNEKPIALTDETWSEDEEDDDGEVYLRIQALYHGREAMREEDEQRRAEQKKWREALQVEKAAVEAASRPTVHVVGRKRKPLEEDDLTPQPGEESVTVKRIRLLDRVVSPFASLVRRRTVASSTPLPARRSQPIVGINTDLPLHGPIGVEPEILPLPEEAEVLKMAPAELPTVEPAAEAREDSRQKCAVM